MKVLERLWIDKRERLPSAWVGSPLIGLLKKGCTSHSEHFPILVQLMGLRVVVLSRTFRDTLSWFPSVIANLMGSSPLVFFFFKVCLIDNVGWEN